MPPDDVVIVCDGPLTPALDMVLKEFATAHPMLIQIIRLSENRGIGAAANEGLSHCRYDLVAKMDADDISLDDRCEKQLRAFQDDPSLSIVGGQLAEFQGETGNIVAIRKVPLSQDEIIAFAKRRMPFNNQTVMYRKQAVIDIGAYKPLRRCEDYDLFARLLHQGYEGKNLSDVLVYFRLNEDAYQRRGNWSNTTGFIKVRWGLFRSGFSSFWDFIIPSVAQFCLMFLPNKLLDTVYRKFLR